MKVPTVFAVEGLDRLGKTTLINGIQEKLGFYQVIHFSKPQRLKVYESAVPRPGVPAESAAVHEYQRESFLNSMLLARSGARVIFDRWHLGEVVYSPLYRGYDGEYVFELERAFQLESRHDIRLILLAENFSISRHFTDDGKSLGPIEKREEEQRRFIDAFNRSCVPDKRLIWVTDPVTGEFRKREDILAEALE